MADPTLTVAGTPRSPELRFHVNPSYCLYQYLAVQGELPGEQRNPATAAAAERLRGAQHPRGVHGLWTAWELPLATGASADEAIAGLHAAMARTADEVGAALALASGEFRRTIFPERRQRIEAALVELGGPFAERFPALAARQADLLDLLWPERIDVYAVADCHGRGNAYSHPLTVDVTAEDGSSRVETILHEATHVADLHTLDLGRSNLGGRLRSHLVADGARGSRAWHVWHALIFAASGHVVRELFDPAHVDYAAVHGLYGWFNAPDLPTLVPAFASGEMTESDLFSALAATASAERPPHSTGEERVGQVRAEPT